MARVTFEKESAFSRSGILTKDGPVRLTPDYHEVVLPQELIRFRDECAKQLPGTFVPTINGTYHIMNRGRLLMIATFDEGTQGAMPAGPMFPPTGPSFGGPDMDPALD